MGIGTLSRKMAQLCCVRQSGQSALAAATPEPPHESPRSPHAAAANAPEPRLPDQVLTQIFQQLPARDLFAAAAVSQDWHRVALAHPSLWEPHAQAMGLAKPIDPHTDLPTLARRVVVDHNIRRGQARRRRVQRAAPYPVHSSPHGNKVLVPRAVSWGRHAGQFEHTLIDVATDTTSGKILDTSGYSFGSWSADGRYLVAYAKEAHVVDTLTGNLVASLASRSRPEWNDAKTAFAFVTNFGIQTYDCLTLERCILSGIENTRAMSWSPQGDRLAAQWRHGAEVFDIASNLSLTKIWRPAEHVFDDWSVETHRLTWSPNGRALAIEWDIRKLGVYDGSTGALLYASMSDYRCRPPQWAPDSQRLAIPFGYQVEIASMTHAPRMLQLPDVADTLRWNHAGTHLVTTQGSASCVLDAVSGAIVRTHSFHRPWIRTARWSPTDACYVVSAHLRPSHLHQTAAVVNASSGAVIASASFFRGRYEHMDIDARFNAQGTRVALYGPDAVVLVDALTGRELARWANQRQTTTDPWSPDRTKLLVHDGRAMRIHDADGVLLAEFKCAAAQSCRWSPSGAQVVLFDNRDQRLNVQVFDFGR